MLARQECARRPRAYLAAQLIYILLYIPHSTSIFYVACATHLHSTLRLCVYVSVLKCAETSLRHVEFVPVEVEKGMLAKEPPHQLPRAHRVDCAAVRVWRGRHWLVAPSLFWASLLVPCRPLEEK